MAISPTPATTKALVLRQSQTSQKALYHEVILEERTLVSPKVDEVVVRMHAVAFNHRELWIRKGLYPGIVFGAVLGADGVGTVISAGNTPHAQHLVGKRVILVPTRGWESAPDAPEARFGIMGGGDNPPIGAFSEYVVVKSHQVIEAPTFIDDIHIAAWPVAGLTAWRAISVHAKVKAGDHLLITGIGGGVALLALQLCVAMGAIVYVTSGNDEKIKKAVSLGAKAGVNYNSQNWDMKLAKILKDDSASLGAVVDSGGGQILTRISKLMKPGGKIICYGMTASPEIAFTMKEVLKNIQLIGTTMGSRNDLVDATKFIQEHDIHPVVSHVINGLELFEEGFELMKSGDHFGKIVIRINEQLPRNKL